MDVLCHPSESKTVMDSTSLSNTTDLNLLRRPSSELADAIQSESFESLIVDSILKCSSTKEHKPDTLTTNVADIIVDDKEAHEVVMLELHEEVEMQNTEGFRKISIKSSNVTSEVNLAQVIEPRQDILL